MAFKEDKQLVFGRKPVLELIRSGKQVEKIFIQKGLTGPFEIELRQLLKGRDIPVSVVHPMKLNKMTKGNHQGIVAFSAIVSYGKLEEIVPHILESGKDPLLLFLDEITDVRNFGAIIRSAEVFGVHGVIFPSKNSALINQMMIKASAGAIFNMPLIRVKSTNNAIEFLKESGIRVLSSSLSAPRPLHKMEMDSPVCIVLGSEETGISNHVAKLSDEMFIIPQLGKTDSLNVSVAAGIILYEVMRQRAD
jgi:23S rRNA (guanosine2251-2'-O)-methyltransferase